MSTRIRRHAVSAVLLGLLGSVGPLPEAGDPAPVVAARKVPPVRLEQINQAETSVPLRRAPRVVLADLSAVRLGIADLLAAQEGAATPDHKILRRDPDDLRRRARGLRDAAALVHTSAVKSSAEETLRVSAAARRLLDPVYQDLPANLQTVDIAAVLESIAAFHDDAVLRERYADLSLRAVDNEVLQRLVPPAGLPGVTRLDAGNLSLRVLLNRHETLYKELRAALESLAGRAVTDLQLSRQRDADPVSTTAELVAAWLELGHRRLGAVVTAVEQIGVRYRFAGRDPAGFDCSGLTSYAWGASGVFLHTSSFSQREQVHKTRKIEDLQPGDLFFYERFSLNSRRPDDLVGHVGMYLGVENIMVDANQGTGDVRVGRIESKPLWGIGALRIYEERAKSLLIP